MVRRRHRAALIAVFVLVSAVLPACGEPPAPPEPIGVFVLDRPAMVRAQVEQGIPEATARKHARALRMQIDLRADGTFELLRKLGDEPLETLFGAWIRQGGEITITTTHDGQTALPVPDVVRGSLADDLLVLGSQRGPGDRLVLRRK